MKRNHLYTARFDSPILAYSQERESFISNASLKNLKSLLPQDIDFSQNIDLLGVAFNAAVVNQFNKNDDGIDGALAAQIVQNFNHKPTNIEHDKEKIVGHIIKAGFSEYKGSNKIISAEEAAEMTDPFNIALGAVVYKHVNKDFVNLIERSVDELDTLHEAVSASWEIGFSEYDILIGSKNLKDAERVDPKHFNDIKPMLRAYGGKGAMNDGTKVYRLLKGEIFPLGIGFTTKPAADVKGLYSENVSSKNVSFKDKRDAKAYFDIKNNIFTKKNDHAISHLRNDDVKNKKETNMDIEQILAELKGMLIEKKFSEEAVANMTETFAEAIKKKDEEYRDSMTKAAKEKEEMAKEKEDMKKSVKKVEDELKAAVEKIQEFENFQKQEEAVACFNARMETIDQVYELEDEDRKVLASDLKALDKSDEAFASYQDKLAVMWKHKNKESKAAFEKQIQARIDEEVAKQLSVANASEQKTAEELAQEALENAKASEGNLPNNNESQSQQPPSLREKFAKAFSRDNIVIS
jgi:hypothetical protein